MLFSKIFLGILRGRKALHRKPLANRFAAEIPCKKTRCANQERISFSTKRLANQSRLGCPIFADDQVRAIEDRFGIAKTAADATIIRCN
jgi:hypothetical protein